MISIVIPTFNRPDFMIRTLRYYAAADFKGKLLIGDSSRGDAAERVRAEVRRLAPRLDAAIYDCAGLDDRLTLHRLSTLVATPYVAFIGDDDLLIPSGLQRSVQFLERNSKYVAANGDAWAFDLPSGGIYGRMRIIADYPQPELGHETAGERLSAYLRDYRVSLFSVTRADAWREAWSYTPQVADRAFAAELLPCCMVASLGKICRLQGPYLLRQTAHSARYHLPEVAAWIDRDQWRADYGAFCDALARTLARIDGADVIDARRVADDAFRGGYLDPLLAAVSLRPPVRHAGPVRRMLRRVPGLRNLWRRMVEKYVETRPLVFSWYVMNEWKRLPEQREMRAVIEVLKGRAGAVT